MINKYLNDLDALISASPAIIDVDIIRRDIHDTGLEKIALYCYRIKLKDGSTIEITEMRHIILKSIPFLITFILALMITYYVSARSARWIYS